MLYSGSLLAVVTLDTAENANRLNAALTGILVDLAIDGQAPQASPPRVAPKCPPWPISTAFGEATDNLGVVGGHALVQENKKHPGVITLASGLQYKVLYNPRS